MKLLEFWTKPIMCGKSFGEEKHVNLTSMSTFLQLLTERQTKRNKQYLTIQM